MIYLDHSATTKPFVEVVDFFGQALLEAFYNPVALYKPAVDLAIKQKEALTKIANCIGAQAHECVVTSGGSESTAAVFHSVCLRGLKGKGKGDIIISAGEHAATREQARFAETLGYTVHVLPLLPSGHIDLTVLASVLSHQTVLVSVMSVQNEVGAYNDPKQIVKLCRQHAPQALVHIDHVQAWNKHPIHLHAEDVDFASFSGHKIHGLKGIGLLYIKKGVAFHPLILGGGQQSGLRSGTEHPVAVEALAMACQMGHQHLAERTEQVFQLRQTLLDTLNQTLTPEDYRINGSGQAVPHILSLSFSGVKGETLLHLLERDEIYVSTGSACSNTKPANRARVFKAMGVDAKWLDGILRISIDPSNTKTEMAIVAQKLVRYYQQLRTIR